MRRRRRRARKGYKYKIIGHIEEGGYARIHKVVDRHNRVFALKTLKPELREEQAKTLRDEARLISELDHPHIVRYHDRGFDGEFGEYLVMELVRGLALDHILEGHGPPLTLPDALDIAIQISHALLEIHRKEIIYRDLKPRNIVVSRNGEVTAKLLDFGIARESTMKDTDVITGSPAYISPEALIGVESFKVDMYSLGITMFEMLTGRRPIDADSVQTLVYKHIYVVPPRIDEVADYPYPKKLVDLVDRLLRKDPDERPLNMEEIIIELVDCSLSIEKKSHF